MRPIPFLILIGFLFASVPIIAQEKKEPHENVVIYYLDGSVFIGEVVSRAGQLWQIKLTTQDTININTGLIKKMSSSNDLLIYRAGKYHFRKGAYGYLSLGGGGGGDGGSVQMDIMAGYRIKERIGVGMGLGIYSNNTEIVGFWTQHSFANLYGYGRYYLSKKAKVRTFLDMKLGYGFALPGWMEDYSGGMLIQPGISVHFPSRNNFRFIISLSQYLQNTSGDNLDFGFLNTPVQTDYNIWYNRTIFKLAIEFK